MCTETEAKLKVQSHETIVERLRELGAEFSAEQLHTDHYFEDADSTFTKNDTCLRLRQLVADGVEKAFLTYKGPKEKHDYKKRKEIEFEVGDPRSAEKLLTALGYKKVLVFEKTRKVWRLDKCEVALDELPLLGCFVEIEGPDGERIADVQEKLGMSNLPHIRESYAALVAQKQLKRSAGQ